MEQTRALCCCARGKILKGNQPPPSTRETTTSRSGRPLENYAWLETLNRGENLGSPSSPWKIETQNRLAEGDKELHFTLKNPAGKGGEGNGGGGPTNPRHGFGGGNTSGPTPPKLTEKRRGRMLKARKKKKKNWGENGRPLHAARRGGGERSTRGRGRT